MMIWSRSHRAQAVVVQFGKKKSWIIFVLLWKSNFRIIFFFHTTSCFDGWVVANWGTHGSVRVLYYPLPSVPLQLLYFTMLYKNCVCDLGTHVWKGYIVSAQWWCVPTQRHVLLPHDLSVPYWQVLKNCTNSLCCTPIFSNPSFILKYYLPDRGMYIR